MNKFKGFLYGMTASATFGLLPLFTLPTMAEGMTTDSILCYRMLFASLLVAVLMMVRRVNFSVGLLRAELARPLGLLLLWVGYSALPGLWEYVERDGHDAALPLSGGRDAHYGGTLQAASFALHDYRYYPCALGCGTALAAR